MPGDICELAILRRYPGSGSQRAGVDGHLLASRYDLVDQSRKIRTQIAGSRVV